MSSINRIIAKALAKSNGNIKIVHGNVVGNIAPDVEWRKWLSYESEFEKNRIKMLETRKNSELSFEEVEELRKYRRNRMFAELFRLYEIRKCSYEEYMMVYDFMCTESIEELMLSKLSLDELSYAKDEIVRLSKVSKEDLEFKVKEAQKIENYDKLSMVDAYILHVISNIKYARNMSDSDKQLRGELERNNAIRCRSLYYAYKSYVRK